MKTYLPKPGENQQWLLIDAEDKILGRVAAEAASLLRGKHKPTYTPFLDSGDCVVIINADKIRVTGKKLEDKMYYRHSGYRGGMRECNLQQMMDKHPTRALTLAITGMLPHNSLGRKLATHVRVYAGPDHEQTAQNPKLHEF